MFPKAAILACLLPLSGAAPVDMSELCKLGKVGTHPAVDLNLATGAKDYVVPSKGYPTMGYIFQVCDKLKYTDTLCTEGSTMCEVEKGMNTAKEVYGYVDSIKLEWDTVPSTVDDDVPEEAVMMSMQGRPSCAVNPTTPAVTKIYFTCDELGDKEPTLLVESEYGCYVEILFPTPHVCDSPPPPQKYACEGNKCIFDSSGTTLAECQGSCGSEKMYTCDKDACVEVPTGGKGVAKELCDSICGGGKPPPPPSPPASELFKCHEGKCELSTDGKGVTKAQCEAVCTAPPPPPPSPPASDLFKCHEGKCELSTDGKGVTKAQCEAVCTAPPPPPPSPPASDLFKCHEGKCEVTAAGGKGVTKAQCEAVCTAPPPSPPSPAGDKYKCHEGKCEVATNGKGVTKVQCAAVCTDMMTFYY